VVWPIRQSAWYCGHAFPGAGGWSVGDLEKTPKRCSVVVPNFGPPPPVVVLIDTSHGSTWHVAVEVWTEVDNPHQRSTRGKAAKILECTQRVEFTNGSVRGGPLTLDFELLMRRAPRNSKEHDIIMDAYYFSLICARCDKT
jgi:hypothetical protein